MNEAVYSWWLSSKLVLMIHQYICEEVSEVVSCEDHTQDTVT